MKHQKAEKKLIKNKIKRRCLLGESYARLTRLNFRESSRNLEKNVHFFKGARNSDVIERT